MIKKISFTLFFLTFFSISFFSFAENLNSSVFSSKIINEDRDGSDELFVVNGDKYFIRYVDGDKFEYKKPEDGCFLVEKGVIICIENEKVFISGKHHSVLNQDKIKKEKYFDSFFNEKNIECDLMKFDIINKIFIKKETMEGYEMQIYLPDYFSLLRFVVYKKDDTENLYGFVISDKNEVGCSPFEEYVIYKNKNNDDGDVKKKKKKKKIEAKTKKEFLKKLSTETYKKMLLDDYTYLLPANAKHNPNDIVLLVENTKIKNLNSVAVDFEWNELGYDELHTDYSPIAKQEEKKKKKPKKGSIVNKKKISGGVVGVVVN